LSINGSFRDSGLGGFVYKFVLLGVILINRIIEKKKTIYNRIKEVDNEEIFFLEEKSH